MAVVSDLTVRATGDFGNLLSGFGSVSGAAQGMLGSLGRINPVVGIFAAVGAAAVGFGAASIKAAGDFQSGITTLSTGAGEAQSNLKMVGDGILNLATSTGTSTKQLTDGMFMIESAGYHGSQGLAVLTAAARGAKVGQADLGVVSDATTTIMTDFASKNITASQAVNTLIAVVSNGKTNMQALSASLSNIMPTASAAGVSLTDTSAAMATMTGEGVPAAQAATYLRQTIIGLEAPSKQTVTALQNVGLSSKQVSDEMKKSLPDALKMITDAVGKKFPEGSAEYVNAIKNISGGSKTMQGMLDLTGSHMQTFQANVTNISNAVKKGGDSINGWAQVQQDFNFKVDQAKEALEALGIKVGQALLPVMGNLLSQITPLISSFGSFSGQIAPLIGNFSSLFSATSPLAPTLSNIAGIFPIMGANWQQASGLLAPLITTLGQFGTLVGRLLPGFISFFLLMMNNANSIIVSLASAFMAIGVPAIRIFGQVLQGAQQFLGPIINAVSNSLVPAIQGLVAAITPVIVGFLSWIANSGMIVPIMAGIGSAVGVVVNILSFLINALASVIVFFTQTELGGAILKAILITLGIVIGGIGVIIGVIVAVVLPGLIAGFVATATAAIATGISIALAFLPITLIVLGVIAVITLVVLAITHWGQIAAWLQGVWAAIASFFQTLWSSILQIVTSAGASIASFMTNLWTGIVSAALTFGQMLLNAFLAPFQAIGNLFVWLYAHNVYFQALADIIISLTRMAVSFLQSAWSSAVNFVVGLFNVIVGACRAAWGAVSGAIMTAINVAHNAIVVGFNAALSFLLGIWSNIVSSVQTAWAKISSIFSSAWGTYISGPLNSLKSSISGFFTGLASDALSWGSNIINMIANGISNAAGAVTGAATNVINNVKNILGFHSPAKEGPGSDADRWAPNLMSMYAGGISGGVSQVRGAALNVANELLNMNGSASYQYGGRSTAMALAAGSAAASSNGGGNQTITIYLDGDVLTRAVSNKQMKNVRLQGGRKL